MNIIGTQQKPEDALKFSSFQALFERIQDAKPNKSINQDDFETLREFVLLKSRNKARIKLKEKKIISKSMEIQKLV